MNKKEYEYKFANKMDGEIRKVKIDKNLYSIIAELDRKEKNNNRTETRRHLSFDRAVEQEDISIIVDKQTNVAEQVVESAEKSAKLKILYKALQSLNESQRQLVYDVFYLEKKIKDIAVECGVSFQTVYRRLHNIIEKLKEFF